MPIVFDAHAHIRPMATDYMSVDAERLLAEQRRFGITASIVSSFEALQWSPIEGNENVIRDAEYGFFEPAVRTIGADRIL